MRRLWELSFILCLCFSQNAMASDGGPCNPPSKYKFTFAMKADDGEQTICEDESKINNYTNYVSGYYTKISETTTQKYICIGNNCGNVNDHVLTVRCNGRVTLGANPLSTVSPTPFSSPSWPSCYPNCPSYCDKCDIKNGVPFCSHCLEDHGLSRYVTSSGQCSQCPSCGHCPNGKDLVAWFNCYMNNGSPQSCPTGKYSDIVSGGGIEKCKTCPTGCTKCSYAYEKGKVWCQACDDGYTLKDGQCVQQEKYTIEFYDKKGSFDSITKNAEDLTYYISYLQGNYEQHYYSCATDKEQKRVVCSCSGAGSSWHGYFKDKSRCEAWINSQSGFCDVIDGYSSSHPNCQYVAKYCSNGCKKCTSSSNCTECSSGFRLENGYCKEIKEYSIMFTDKGGNKKEQNKLSFYPGTAADIMEQFWTIYDSAKARCSVGDSEILCTCAQTGTGSYYNDYFMSMERCNSYKAEQEASNADGVFCEMNDATDNICPIKSTRCSANCKKCTSTSDPCECKDGYTWNAERKMCLPPTAPVDCPSPLAYSADGRSCEFKCSE